MNFDGNNEILINLLSDFYFWLFLMFMAIIGWIFKKFVLSRFQKVNIKKIDIRNVPKLFNGFEAPAFQHVGAYQNYIENELVIENLKNDLLVHNLVINRMEVRDYLYEDVIIQNGFDMRNQEVSFVIFNNGNIDSSSRNYQMKCYYLNKINNKERIILDSELKCNKLRGGDIKTLFSQKLVDHKIIKYFSDNLPDFKQSIKIGLINKENDNIESEIEIPYLSSQKSFVRNLGGGGPVDRKLIPIVELLSPYNKDEFNFKINQPIPKGESTLRFNILVDAPCSLKYIVQLKSEGRLLATFSMQDINIQFPKYVLNSPYKDELYHYLHNAKIEESNFEEVRLREPRLINSVENIKKEYNLDY